MKHSRWSKFLYFLLCVGTVTAISRAETIFTEASFIQPGLAYSSAAWGDFNNDKRQDLLLAGANDSFTPVARILRNAGSSYEQLELPFSGASSSAVAWGDLDNDGRLDVLISGFAGINTNAFPVYLTELWRNEGDGTFQKLDAGLPGINNGSVTWGDFDNDNRLDIVLTGFRDGGGIAQIWRNNGNGTFSNWNAGLTGVFYSSVARADFNSDGYVDLVVTGTTNGFLNGAITEVWRNAGNRSFERINSNLPPVSQGSVAAGDLNNDGHMDLFLTGYSGSGQISQVWLNEGNGNFTNSNVPLSGVYQSSATLGDFDNDGWLDLLFSGKDANTNVVSQVWRNTGGGNFTNLNETLTGVHSGSSTWGDSNNDGKLDILLSGLDASNNPVLKLFLNQSVEQNTLEPDLNLSGLSEAGRPLRFRGKTAFGYTVHGSSQLSTNWTILGPALEISPGQFQWVDGTNSSVKFYKVSTP